MDDRPRRSPQPSIDPALVIPGARFKKNRPQDQGAPPVFVIVDVVEMVTTLAGDYQVVRYHNAETGRRGKMPLKEFCQGSEHKLPDPEPEQAEPVAEPAPVLDVVAEIRALHTKLDELIGMARQSQAGPLFQRAR